MHLEELDHWTAKLGLTGYRTQRARAIHLTLDSLILVSLLPSKPGMVLDIGSGAGFPGLVIKVLRPDCRVILVEVNRRRANFLRHARRVLQLEGLEILEDRIERVTGVLGTTVDVVTSRAVMAPRTVVNYAAALLRPGGILLIPLGPSGPCLSLPQGWSCEVVTRPLPFSSIQRQILRICAPAETG